MALGRFGSRTPLVRRVSGFGGGEAIGGVAEEARGFLLSGPEGDLAIREQVSAGAMSAESTASSTTATSTTSGTYVALDSMSVTLTFVASTTAGFVIFSGDGDNTLASGTLYLIMQKDAVDIASTERFNQFTSAGMPQYVGTHTLDTAPTAASHTYRIMWRVTAGTAEMTRRAITVMELRR